MAFIIKKDIIKQHQETTQEFTHQETGFVASFRSISHKDFQRAWAVVAQNTNYTALSMANIKDVNHDELTQDEALGYAIGEHLIADWNVEDENGKLDITGDNFSMVLASVDDHKGLVLWCLGCAEEVAKTIRKQATELAKKPSKGGDGNKTTKN
ncbi:MAG: hypothetical protein Q3971_03110 [Moraxella sp.]|nr:hypothetical protein [Moraxella sp.]